MENGEDRVGFDRNIEDDKVAEVRTEVKVWRGARGGFQRVGSN